MPASVTALIIAFNSPAVRLERCIAALRATQGCDVEIVVVDNASQELRGHEAADRVIRRLHNDGFAAAVNDGIRAATAEFVAILNDDAVVSPTAMMQCVSALSAQGQHVLAAAPKVLFAGTDGPFIDSAGLVVRPNGDAFSAGAGQPDIGQFDPDRTVLGPCMSAALFRRSAFDTIGLLDERYFLYYEDVDWALRCFLSGHDTIFVPDAVVHHEHAASTRALGERRRFRMVQRNRLLCATANLSMRSVVRIWTDAALSAAKAAVKGPDRTSRLRSLAAAALRAPSAVGARRARRRAATRPDGDAFRFAEGLSPHVDVQHYRPDHPVEARREAEARLARARAAG